MLKMEMNWITVIVGIIVSIGLISGMYYVITNDDGDIKPSPIIRTSAEVKDNCVLKSSGETLSIDNVGDLTELKDSATTTKLSYYEFKNKVIIGFEKVYDVYTCTEEVCTYVNDTEGIGVIDFCENVSTDVNVLTDKKGKPIYKNSEITAIEYSGNRYNFNDKGCSVCDSVKFETGKTLSGKYLLCISRNDGYVSTLKDCWVEDGVSYSIKNLDDDKIVESGGNFEVKIEN